MWFPKSQYLSDTCVRRSRWKRPRETSGEKLAVLHICQSYDWTGASLVTFSKRSGNTVLQVARDQRGVSSDPSALFLLGHFGKRREDRKPAAGIPPLGVAAAPPAAASRAVPPGFRLSATARLSGSASSASPLLLLLVSVALARSPAPFLRPLPGGARWTGCDVVWLRAEGDGRKGSAGGCGGKGPGRRGEDYEYLRS